jgi:hypothetical protein
MIGMRQPVISNEFLDDIFFRVALLASHLQAILLESSQRV